ncbi:glycosyltransferase family 4 protein [Pseudonocardia sp. EV170527-09]|uniref:glycosyltransferase family 4 protein n=1 Tax=Pseudonocardia sp. EV170527-09 TaxID=2603411 RepID=UPI0011F39348|nr:glycosyltransferase family 4 protein [Pseudonocardia sp. EV170527-09]KAA1014052.1 glycosyltransferase family 4 protein [Pseudonocardia sp. EV170527-09]
MHIALVHRDLHAATRGGIATIYRALAPRLHQAGHQVTLLTQDSPEVLHLPGIDTVVLARTEDMSAHRAAVAAALDLVQPDVVESSTWEAETLHYLHTPPHGWPRS